VNAALLSDAGLGSFIEGLTVVAISRVMAVGPLHPFADPVNGLAQMAESFRRTDGYASLSTRRTWGRGDSSSDSPANTR